MAAPCKFLIDSKLTSLQVSYTLATLCDWCVVSYCCRLLCELRYRCVQPTVLCDGRESSTQQQYTAACRAQQWQTLQKKWMVNQRQPRTPFTAVNSSATSVHHTHRTPVVQYITAVPAAQIYIFFTVADSVNDACCILSSLYISYKDVIAVAGWEQ